MCETYLNDSILLLFWFNITNNDFASYFDVLIDIFFWSMNCSLFFMTHPWLVHKFQHNLLLCLTLSCKLWYKKWISWHKGHFLSLQDTSPSLPWCLGSCHGLGSNKTEWYVRIQIYKKMFNPFPSNSSENFWFCLLHREMGENNCNWGCVSSGRVQSSSLKCYLSLRSSSFFRSLFKQLPYTLHILLRPLPHNLQALLDTKQTSLRHL